MVRGWAMFLCAGATGFDVPVEASVARRGPRLASLNFREKTQKPTNNWPSRLSTATFDRSRLWDGPECHLAGWRPEPGDRVREREPTGRLRCRWPVRGQGAWRNLITEYACRCRCDACADAGSTPAASTSFASPAAPGNGGLSFFRGRPSLFRPRGFRVEGGSALG